MQNFSRYIPLSDEAKSANLYVIAGGYTHIPSHARYPLLQHPSDHDFCWRDGRTLFEYQAVYITRGGGIFESKTGGARHIRTGDLFLLFPEEWHRYSPDPESGWDEYWVAFNGQGAKILVDTLRVTPAEPVIAPGLNEMLIEEYHHIVHEMQSEAVGHTQVLSARCSLVLALASASFQRRSLEGTQILQVIERAKCLLLEQSDQAVNIEALAKSLGVGYSRFRRAFREYTGFSPAQYHLQLRINRAAELLRGTTLPVQVIAETLGFESSYYFSRIFSEKLGSSPRAYRARIQSGAAPTTQAR